MALYTVMLLCIFTINMRDMGYISMRLIATWYRRMPIDFSVMECGQHGLW